MISVMRTVILSRTDTADVRVAQYESGTRTPKLDMLTKIANILDVNIDSLREPTLEDTTSFLHLLFNLEMEAEQRHTNNFSIVSVPDDTFKEQAHPAIQFHNHLLEEFLLEWQLRRIELRNLDGQKNTNFSTTLFLCPGYACIYGNNVVGTENGSGNYLYETDPIISNIFTMTGAYS